MVLLDVLHLLFLFSVHNFDLAAQLDALLVGLDQLFLGLDTHLLVLVLEVLVIAPKLLQLLLLLVQYDQTLVILTLHLGKLLLGLDELLQLDIEVIVDALQAVDLHVALLLHLELHGLELLLHSDDDVLSLAVPLGSLLLSFFLLGIDLVSEGLQLFAHFLAILGVLSPAFLLKALDLAILLDQALDLLLHQLHALLLVLNDRLEFLDVLPLVLLLPLGLLLGLDEGGSEGLDVLEHLVLLLHLGTHSRRHASVHLLRVLHD